MPPPLAGVKFLNSIYGEQPRVTVYNLAPFSCALTVDHRDASRLTKKKHLRLADEEKTTPTGFLAERKCHLIYFLPCRCTEPVHFPCRPYRPAFPLYLLPTGILRSVNVVHDSRSLLAQNNKAAVVCLSDLDPIRTSRRISASPQRTDSKNCSKRRRENATTAGSCR
ncbi:hypothetical protein BaRGS_00028955 [Batillaria attramentaria]|uniref:Uncharacterized protein n=1 Tax=Batillaria attramentaria TaxID=370345 RepID=A0ABD0JYJ3_9CAEN